MCGMSALFVQIDKVYAYWYKIVMHISCFHSFRLGQLDGASGNLDLDKLWKQPQKQDYVPCVEPSLTYKSKELLVMEVHI